MHGSASRERRPAMDDFDDELREIKREIVESRGLTIKTNNLTNALAADLKSMSKRQLGFERRVYWNSGAAYVVFVVVVIAVVKVAWDARVATVSLDLVRSQAKLQELEKSAEEGRVKGNQRVQSEADAAEFYELIRAERRQEVIDGFEVIRKKPLTRAELAFFTDAVDRARSELSVRAYQLGVDHARTGRWHEAAGSLEEAIRLKETSSHTPSARLHLAKAYRKLNRQRDAIPILNQLSEASPDKEVMDDATFLLAECLVDIQAWNDAKSTLRSFIRRFPESAFINDARMALADLSIKH
jgi:TolA-binding protein